MKQPTKAPLRSFLLDIYFWGTGRETPLGNTDFCFVSVSGCKELLGWGWKLVFTDPSQRLGPPLAHTCAGPAHATTIFLSLYVYQFC